jgi:hypothetical protein
MRVQKEPAGSEAAEEAPGPPADREYLEATFKLYKPQKNFRAIPIFIKFI